MTSPLRFGVDEKTANLYEACRQAYDAYRRARDDEWEDEDERLAEFGVCVG